VGQSSQMQQKHGHRVIKIEFEVCNDIVNLKYVIWNIKNN